MIKKYNKLVRDKIPEIIEASGKMCVTERLSDERYFEHLNAKLTEECTEFRIDGSLEELVDIIEVVYAIANAKGVSNGELDRIRQEKVNRNGKFENRIFLKEVTDW